MPAAVVAVVAAAVEPSAACRRDALVLQHVFPSLEGAKFCSMERCGDVKDSSACHEFWEMLGLTDRLTDHVG